MRKLPQLDAQAEGLGRPTIMDRALAQDHGVRYVHLVVFAIDVDRVAEAGSDQAALPLGWEVFLTEYVLLEELGEPSEAELALLEDLCESVLERPGGAQALGTQLGFAIYDAIERGALPEALRAPFRRWRSAPKQLISELTALWATPGDSARRFALHCLAQKLEPPLAEPTLETLQELAGVSEPG